MTKLMALVSAFTLSACAGIQSDNAYAYLSSSELAQKCQEAKNGSGDAALSVATYYHYWKYDKIEAIKWMRMSAENGNSIAKHNLGVMLESSSNPEDRKEAAHWLAEANKEGVIAPTR